MDHEFDPLVNGRFSQADTVKMVVLLHSNSALRHMRFVDYGLKMRGKQGFPQNIKSNRA